MMTLVTNPYFLFLSWFDMPVYLKRQQFFVAQILEGRYV